MMLCEYGELHMAELTPIAVSIDDACAISGLKRTKLYEEIKSGRLVSRKSGTRTLIRVVDLQAFIDALPVSRAEQAAA